MSDFFCEKYISQELNKYNTIYENEIDIKEELKNINFSEFVNIFNSNQNIFELDNDDPIVEVYFFTGEKTNKSTSHSSTLIKSIFNIEKVIKKENNNKNNKFTQKKRGRHMKIQNNSNIETNNQKPHDKFANDNLLRKIQVHYITFIISAINSILQALDYDEKFLKIDYELKKNINKDYFESLKNKKLSEIVCNKISKQYKNYDSDFNINIYNKIKDDEIIKNLFNESYLIFFKNFYYKSGNTINLKKYGLEKEIILSNDVKKFDDLLQDKLDENINNEKYTEYIYACVAQNYFPDINKTRFKIFHGSKMPTLIN